MPVTLGKSDHELIPACWQSIGRFAGGPATPLQPLKAEPGPLLPEMTMAHVRGLAPQPAQAPIFQPQPQPSQRTFISLTGDQVVVRKELPARPPSSRAVTQGPAHHHPASPLPLEAAGPSAGTSAPQLMLQSVGPALRHTGNDAPQAAAHLQRQQPQCHESAPAQPPQAALATGNRQRQFRGQNPGSSMRTWDQAWSMWLSSRATRPSCKLCHPTAIMALQHLNFRTSLADS